LRLDLIAALREVLLECAARLRVARELKVDLTDVVENLVALRDRVRVLELDERELVVALVVELEAATMMKPHLIGRRVLRRGGRGLLVGARERRPRDRQSARDDEEGTLHVDQRSSSATRVVRLPTPHCRYSSWR